MAGLSLETMTKDFDFKADKPSWPLSSYGPAKHEKNLLPPLDESPEELRLKAATAMRNGNISEYVCTLIALYQTIRLSM
jgi:nucleoporin NUP42